MDRPSTLAEIDAQLATDRRLEQAAIDSGQDGVVEWYALEIERLENLRRIVDAGSTTVDALLRMRRRGVAARYAAAEWAGETAKAAELRDELDRLERGQL